MKHKLIILLLFLFCIMSSFGNSVYASDFPAVERRAYYEENELGFFGMVSLKSAFSQIMSSVNASNLPIPGLLSVERGNSRTAAFGVAGTLGYKFTPLLGMRTELEYMYRLQARTTPAALFTSPAGIITRGNVDYSVTISTLMTNFYLDFYINKRIALYAGAGIGMAITDQISSAENRDITGDITFSWNASVGTIFTILKFLTLDIGVRYSDFGTASNDETLILIRNKLRAIEIIAGLSYKF